MIRLAKPLAILLVAAQLLLAVPALAMSVAQAGSHCAQAAGDSHPDKCPCCPEGSNSMKDCLASCTLAVAAPMQVMPAEPAATHFAAFSEPRAFESLLSAPPLKPPPIV